MAGKKEKPIYKGGEATQPLQQVPEAEGAIEVVLPTPPDGGWGWVIVASSLMANIIVDGITYTFGIFLPKFEDAFQQPKSTIALAGSLQVGTYLCAGPIVSAMTNRFGCKRVMMVGSVIATVGFVLSVFAPSANILIFTYGIIGGFGFGMIYLPAVVIVGYYFEKRRALATGIAVCGSGIGMFIMAPLSDMLLQEYGYKGALLIIGGLVFNGAICGALMRPLPLPKVQQQPIVKQPQVTNGTSSKSSTTPIVITSLGNDVNDTDASSTPPKHKQVLAIEILDGQGSSPAGGQSRGQYQPFSSMPSMAYSSARGGEARAQTQPRQRSNTLDNIDKIRLRHVGREVIVHADTPKKAATPIGLSYIGLSDANINRVRASTHINVSRRDIFVSGSVLHIPDHSVHTPGSGYIRSMLSMKSHRSVMSEVEEKMCACLPESARETLLQMLDFSILKNKAYLFILLGNVLAMLGFYVPFVYIPEKAMEQGISEGQAAMLLSIIGITNTVGRVLTGVLANLNKIDSLLINNIAMLVCGIATFITPFCDSYALLCFIAAVFGLCVAAYISLSSILLCDMLGVEQLTNAFGFLTLARGISSCAGSPVAGFIIDTTHNIDLAFFVGGALITAGSFSHFLLHTPCIRQKPPPVTAVDIVDPDA